jgi:hypothetical protein
MMVIVDSTNGNRDSFGWIFYNSDLETLMGLSFNNETKKIYYFLGDDERFKETGYEFANETIYQLSINIDFVNNLWSASTEDANLVENKKITTLGKKLNLGAFDASWLIHNKNSPGNNYMIFDDYSVSIESKSSTVKPVITLIGSATVTVEAGSSYTDAGVTASDSLDGDLTGSVVATNTVDMNTPGTYTLTYSATDAAGNTTTAIRTVTVADTTAPVITLNGSGTVTHEAATNYTDAGASSVDAVDGSVTVTTSGSVDVGTPAIYTLTYSATDAAGNTITATRTVTVESPELVSAEVILSGMNQTHDGNEKKVTVRTDPDGLSVMVTYTDSEGSPVANPTNAGSYTVNATIDDANYKGTATGTLTIKKAQAGITVSGTNQTYDESEKKVTVTTDPAGLNVVVTYIDSEGTAVSSPTEVGEYVVVATVSDENYKGITSVTLSIVAASGVADPFGEPVTYANNTHTVYGTVTLDGVAATKGDDVVAVYVGDELRGKHVVQAVNEGVAYVTIQVNVNEADEQTSRFVVWDADQSDEELQTLTLRKKTSLEPGGETELLAFDFKSTLIQEVSLKKGWNLISFYVESEDMTPATVLGSIKDKLVQIKNLKNSYNPTLPAFINTLKGLNVEDGYWVKVSEDVSFELEGSVPEGASIPVRLGWNLVGYPRESGAAPANELTSLGDTVLQFKNLKDSYNPTLPAFINTLKVIIPGLGYWLKVSEDGVWNVGDVSGDGGNRDISKMGLGESRWGQVVVYPNVSATVLAEVTVEGKAVSSGSVVGAFVGDELRGQQDVVLANGKSYLAINVNLTEAKKARYRIWDNQSGKEYGVTKTMTLEMGETYGTAAELVKLDGVASGSGSTIQIVGYVREPFGFGFESQMGSSYVVEATDDLMEWGAVKSYDGTGTMIRFEEERDQVFPQIYYRVRVE